MTSKSKSLGLAAACATSLSLGACSHGPPAASYAPLPDGWTHLCESRRFVVDFPGQPEEGRRALQGANGPLEAATWSLTSGRRAYLVEYVEYDDVVAPPEEIVARMRADAVRQGRVIDDRPRSGPGWASDDLLVELPMGDKTYATQVRIVLSRQQLFLLITAAPTMEDDQAWATRFLTSLRYHDAALDC